MRTQACTHCSPELTEVFTQDLKCLLQELLHCIALLHLQEWPKSQHPGNQGVGERRQKTEVLSSRQTLAGPHSPCCFQDPRGLLKSCLSVPSHQTQGRPPTAYFDCPPVSRAIPVTEGDFNLFTYKSELPLGLQTQELPSGASSGHSAQSRALCSGELLGPSPVLSLSQGQTTHAQLHKHLLLIFSCLASHSCRSSSRRRFSSS